MGILEEVLERIQGLPPKEREALSEEISTATEDLLWVPTPGPQTEAYFSKADELYYGGQAGGGKTDLITGLAINEHQNSLLLRRTNKEAEKLPVRFEEILGSDDGLNRSTGTWKIPGGNNKRVVDMGGCQLENDKQKRKGIPHDLKAFDEIPDFSESQYTFISAWNRSADPKQRCRVVCTGNPPTHAEGYWVIRRWGAWLDPTHPNPAHDGELRWYTTDEEGKDHEVDGRGPHIINGEEIFARSRTFIRARLSDNPYLRDTDYDAVLASLPERERLAYRDGRFDLSMVDKIGQAIPTEWIKLAQDRWKSSPPESIPMCAMGVDATGGGKDPMVISVRHDDWFGKILSIPGKNFEPETMGKQGAGYVIAERRDNALVIIDLGGGYGNSTYEHLCDNGIDCYGYKGSESSGMRTKDSNIPFKNKRSAAIWRLHEALDPSQPGGSTMQLPEDPELVADLTAPTYEITNHVLVVEAKEKVVARLGRSTNKGDAVIMSWFEGAKASNSALEWIDRKGRSRMRGQIPRVITQRGRASRRRR